MSPPPAVTLLSLVFFAAWCGAARAQLPEAPLPVPQQHTLTLEDHTPLASQALSAKLSVLDRNVTVAADGSWTMTTHGEILVLKDSAIPTLAQFPLNYNDVLQTIAVTEAHVRKADGSIVAVAPDEIVTRADPAASGSPILTDRMQKVIHYPNVEVGDTLVYSATTHARPLLAGSFLFAAVLPSTVAVDEMTITLSLPIALAVWVDARGFEAHKSVAGGRVLYDVHYSNQSPVAAGASSVSDFDKAPRLAVSSFKDYDALAKAYADIALPALAVTPAIQARADNITQGVSDRYEQARLLYDWVLANTRAVATDLGMGQIGPQSGDAVMAKAYGDSEDHAALYAALLKAKGISSNLVLVNATDAYTISSVASLVPFDRAIVWLPEFNLYVDPTGGGFASFGLLPRTEYGKQVIHIGGQGAALHQVPPGNGKNASDSYRLTLRVDDFGHVESESSSTASGDFAPAVRFLGALMQGENGKKLAAAMLAKTPTPNATGAFMASRLDPEQGSYQISATYAVPEALVPLLEGGAFRLGDDLQLLSPFSSNFFGTIVDRRYSSADPVTCFSGSSSDDETVEFPATRHLQKLPQDASVRTAHVTYASHWSQTATTVSVHREFEARFDTPLCNAQVRDEVHAAYVRVLQDQADAIIALPRNAPSR